MECAGPPISACVGLRMTTDRCRAHQQLVRLGALPGGGRSGRGVGSGTTGLAHVVSLTVGRIRIRLSPCDPPQRRSGLGPLRSTSARSRSRRPSGTVRVCALFTARPDLALRRRRRSAGTRYRSGCRRSVPRRWVRSEARSCTRHGCLGSRRRRTCPMPPKGASKTLGARGPNRPPSISRRAAYWCRRQRCPGERRR